MTYEKAIRVICATCGKHDYFWNEENAVAHSWHYETINAKREVPFRYDNALDKLVPRETTYKKNQWFCSTNCFVFKGMKRK